jgi:thiol-disulfide isomerase/thioredoxin
MKVIPLALLGATLLAGCNSAPTTGATETAPISAATLLTPGPWRGELAIQGQQLPFLFEVKTEGGKPVVYLLNKGLNGEERLRCDEIAAAGDSVSIKLHVFDAALIVREAGPGRLRGSWVKYDAKTPYRVPLAATAGAQPLFKGAADPKASFTGTWQTEFKGESDSSYPAVGVFTQHDSDVTGTFLTSTGDYRYLAGQTDGPKVRLTTFDGGHAFLFTGELHNNAGKDCISTISGDFYAGKSGHEKWLATLNPAAKLPDADTLTYLKKGESRLNFKFPSVVQGSSISLTDPKYKGKVVVLQILGSWCPNCMDETAFLVPWYEQNKARGVEVIGLGYERMPEYDKAERAL